MSQTSIRNGRVMCQFWWTVLLVAWQLESYPKNSRTLEQASKYFPNISCYFSQQDGFQYTTTVNVHLFYLVSQRITAYVGFFPRSDYQGCLQLHHLLLPQSKKQKWNQARSTGKSSCFSFVSLPNSRVMVIFQFLSFLWKCKQ